MGKLTLEDLVVNHDAIKKSAQVNGIDIIGIFGSLVGGDDFNNADMQLLIEYQPQRGLADQDKFKSELQEIFKDKGKIITNCVTAADALHGVDGCAHMMEWEGQYILRMAKENSFAQICEKYNAVPSASKIIFLDIDGVLQVDIQPQRFKSNLDKLQADLSVGEPGYAYLDKYDIGAAYYDWYPEAVQLLKDLCENTGAKIVITSQWRDRKTLGDLKLLFKLQQLDGYVIGMTPMLSSHYNEALKRYPTRGEEIETFIADYTRKRKIYRYVILDDDPNDFRKKFSSQFVHCPGVFNDECYKEAEKILKKRVVYTRERFFKSEVTKSMNDVKEADDKVTKHQRSKRKHESCDELNQKQNCKKISKTNL